jgi:hypothetical protein
MKYLSNQIIQFIYGISLGFFLNMACQMEGQIMKGHMKGQILGLFL